MTRERRIRLIGRAHDWHGSFPFVLVAETKRGRRMEKPVWVAITSSEDAMAFSRTNQYFDWQLTFLKTLPT